MMNLKSVIGAAALGLAIVFGVGCAGGADDRGAETFEPNREIIAVSMHADWCGTCKALSPRVASAKDALRSVDVTWVKADITDRTDPIGKRTLERMGLGEVFAKYGNRTGIVILVDADTKEVLKVIRGGGATSETIVRDVRDAISLPA